MTDQETTRMEIAIEYDPLTRVGMSVRARYRLRKCGRFVDKGRVARQFVRECFFATRRLGKCFTVMAGLARGAADRAQPELGDAGA